MLGSEGRGWAKTYERPKEEKEEGDKIKLGVIRAQEGELGNGNDGEWEGKWDGSEV